jgi:ArsR family transcriptional regulator, arsenate/arsenite/antimonite-responsive transcriptional repressor
VFVGSRSPPVWEWEAVMRTSIATIEEPVALCCAPLAESGLSAGESDAIATLFKALGDPTRVRILNLLANSTEAVCVCEINEHFDLSQPTISHHLRKLVLAGLLQREQRGTWAYFSIDQQAWDRLALVLGKQKGTER